MEKTVSKRRGRAFIVFLVLAFLVLIAIGLVSALKIGFAAGMVSAGTVLIVYQVSATAFDWPRMALDDIVAFFESVLDWIADLFSW